MQFLREELKNNWFRYLVLILAIVGCIYVYQDIRSVLVGKNSSSVTQPTEKTVYIDASGRVSSTPPPVYITVQPQVNETGTVGVVEKKDPKTDADVVINDNKGVYKVNYNGKEYNWTPEFKEDYKFEKGQLTYNRQTNMNLSVSLPQPVWGAGIGKNDNGGYSYEFDYRIGNSPFNVWIYHGNENAYGLKFTQYK
jgi:hypothetical protein